MASELRLPQLQQMDVWDWTLAITAPPENQNQTELLAQFTSHGYKAMQIFSNRINNLPANKVPKDIREILQNGLITPSTIQQLGAFCWAIKTLDIWKKYAKFGLYFFNLPDDLYSSSTKVILHAKKFDQWLADHQSDFARILEVYFRKINRASGDCFSMKKPLIEMNSTEQIEAMKIMGAFYWSVKRLRLWCKWSIGIDASSESIEKCSTRLKINKQAEKFDEWFCKGEPGNRNCDKILAKCVSHIKSHGEIMIPLNIYLQIIKEQESPTFEGIQHLYKFLKSMLMLKRQAPDKRMNFLSSEGVINHAKRLRLDS